MERIKSFTINHNILKPGFYISRKDGEIVTYDLRTRNFLYTYPQQAFPPQVSFLKKQLLLEESNRAAKECRCRYEHTKACG